MTAEWVAAGIVTVALGLQPGSVVLDRHGDAWQLDLGCWWMAGSGFCASTTQELIDHFGPLQVIHHGEAG